MRVAFCLPLLTLLLAVRGRDASGFLTETMKGGIKRLGIECMNSVGATMDEMNSIRHGPPYEGKAACALGCILEKAGVMSEREFSKRGLVAAVKPFLLGDAKKLNRIKSISESCDREVRAATAPRPSTPPPTAPSDGDGCSTAENVIVCLRKHIPQIAQLDL